MDRPGIVEPPPPTAQQLARATPPDQTLPGLDRGDSIYDIRHRLVLNYVWQLPGQNLNGLRAQLHGGWSLNGIWASNGAHFEPYTAAQSNSWSLELWQRKPGSLYCQRCERRQLRERGWRLQPRRWSERSAQLQRCTRRRCQSQHVGEWLV